MLDDSAYFAAASLEHKNFVVTTKFSIHFVRPAGRDHQRAVGTVLYRTQWLTVAEAKAFGES